MRRRVPTIGSDAEISKCLRCFVERPDLLIMGGSAFAHAVAGFGCSMLTWEAARALLAPVRSDVDDIRTLTLRKFVDLVYTRPFQSLDDQRIVRDEIDRFFKISDNLSAVDDRCIDVSVPPMVRIGIIYLESGGTVSEDAEDRTTDFVYTPRSVDVLESLAAAVQCSRPVLLEGDTCSGKSALVRELAQLCRRRLTVLSMTHETETSTLIGQWLPIPLKVQAGRRRGSFHKFCHQVLQFLFTHVLAGVEAAAARDPDRAEPQKLLRAVEAAVVYLAQAAQSQSPADSDADVDQLQSELETALQLKALLYDLVDAVDLPLSQFARLQVTYFQKVLKKIEKSFDQAIASAREKEEEGEVSNGVVVFDFVESDLVRAMREGHWILLDNVNSAPPEVIERLNSLFEDDPTLNLVESGGDVLAMGSGIHPHFRVFLTANGHRPNSFKLSSAFLNRVIRLWLEPMDLHLDKETCLRHDSFEMVRALLPAGVGRSKLAALLLSLHGQVNKLIAEKAIGTVGSVGLTFRSALRTVNSFKTLLASMCEGRRTGTTPLDAFVWAIVRSYASCTKDRASAALVLKKIKQLLCDPVITSVPEQTGTAPTRRTLKVSSDDEFFEYEEVVARLKHLAVQALCLAMLCLSSAEDFCDAVVHISRGGLVKGESVVQQRLEECLRHCLHMGGTHSRIDALAELGIPLEDLTRIGTVQDANTEKAKRVCASLEEELKTVVERVVAASSLLARSASFTDATRRTQLLQNARDVSGSILDGVVLIPVVSVAKDKVTAESLTSALVHRLRAILLPLSIIPVYLRRVQLISDPAVQELVTHCSNALSQPANSAGSGSGSLRYLLTRALAIPLGKGVLSLVRMIEAIDLEEPSSEMRRLAVTVRWIGAAWTAIFKIPLHSVSAGTGSGPLFDYSKLYKVR
jgi:MoxR-like ATPase